MKLTWSVVHVASRQSSPSLTAFFTSPAAWIELLDKIERPEDAARANARMAALLQDASRGELDSNQQDTSAMNSRDEVKPERWEERVRDASKIQNAGRRDLEYFTALQELYLPKKDFAGAYKFVELVSDTELRQRLGDYVDFAANYKSYTFAQPWRKANVQWSILDCGNFSGAIGFASAYDGFTNACWGGVSTTPALSSGRALITIGTGCARTATGATSPAARRPETTTTAGSGSPTR